MGKVLCPKKPDQLIKTEWEPEAEIKCRVRHQKGLLQKGSSCGFVGDTIEVNVLHERHCSSLLACAQCALEGKGWFEEPVWSGHMT